MFRCVPCVLVDHSSVHQSLFVPLHRRHLPQEVFAHEATVLQQAVDPLSNYQNSRLFRWLFDKFIKVKQFALEPPVLKGLLGLVEVFFGVAFESLFADDLHSSLVFCLIAESDGNGTHQSTVLTQSILLKWLLFTMNKLLSTDSKLYSDSFSLQQINNLPQVIESQQLYMRQLFKLLMAENHPPMPLLPLRHSHSHTSLYSQHSQPSDSPPRDHKPHPQPSHPPESSLPPAPIIVSHAVSPHAQKQGGTKGVAGQEISVSKLPGIKPNNSKLENSRQKIASYSFSNDAAERYALFNQKVTGIQVKEDSMARQNLFSMNRSRQQKTFQRYGNSQVGEQDKSGKRMLNSNQGSRWLKSQSLAVPREPKTFKHLIRHFHKHNSIMTEVLSRSWQFVESIEKTLLQGPYAISVFDSLQVLKVKMEAYLERQINLENFQNHKPSAEWNQEQYISYYGNYRRVLIEDSGDRNLHKPFTLKKYKNCVFFGHMTSGKKESGILHYFTGKCFEGSFKEDQKDRGLQLDEKQLYLGQFNRGVRWGLGILKTSGSLKVGSFTNGQFSTVGGQKEHNGTSSLFDNYPQEASLSSDNKKGFQISHSAIAVFDRGCCIKKNIQGDLFVGTLGNDGQKVEEGLQLFANGDIYVGKYQSGSPQGYGEYYWENGSHYRGQFLSGMRHGRGTWQMISGDTYEGEYMNDKKNGKGVYLWKNGARYEGNFQNDYRHGYGEMRWQDGRSYKGKWLNGIQKNLIISLDKPQGHSNNKNSRNGRPSFRTLQVETQKRVPLQKLKSIYNPSYQ